MVVIEHNNLPQSKASKSGSDVGCEGLPALLVPAERVWKGGSCLSWPRRWFSDAPPNPLRLRRKWSGS